MSPPPLVLSLSYDCESSVSLYTVWRVTRNHNVSCKHTASARLSNRSWRLLSERMLRCNHRKLDRSLLTLDSPLRPDSDMCSDNEDSDKSERDNSHSVIRDSADSNADSASDHPARKPDAEGKPDAERKPGLAPKASALVERSTALLFQKLTAESHLSLDSGDSDSLLASNSSRSAASLSPEKPFEPSPLASDSSPEKKPGNIFYILNSPSPHDHAPAKSPSSLREGPNGPLTRQDSLFGKTLVRPPYPPNLSSLSSTDISEVSDIEDDETDLEEELYNPVDYTRSTASKSNRSARSMKSATDDNESEWVSISSDSEQVSTSPGAMPLAFPKRIPNSSTASSNLAPASLEKQETVSPSLSKPRSLLSGLFLSEMSMSAHSSPTSAKSVQSAPVQPKPVLKRSSTTGVITVDKNGTAKEKKSMQKPSLLFSKRYASLTDIPKKMASFRSPVLYVEEEETIPEADSRNSVDNLDSLFAKQTSSVGLSDIIATGNSTSNDNTLDVKGRKSPALDRGEATLSSSLSKYSSLHPSAGGSYKSILSKSSLNLSSIFGQNKGNKMRFGSHNRSSETLRAREPVSPLFAEHLLRQNSLEAILEPPSVLSKSIKVAPKPKKNFQPLVEVSESLKDSLLIDHKLGKIPMPERVISDEDLFRGRNRDAFLEDSNDDYHLKGW